MRLTVRDLPAGGVRVRLHRPVRPLPPPPRQRPDGQLGPGRGRGTRHDGGRGRVGRPPQPRPHNSRGQPRQVPLGQGEADRQLSSAVTSPAPAGASLHGGAVPGFYDRLGDGVPGLLGQPRVVRA